MRGLPLEDGYSVGFSLKCGYTLESSLETIGSRGVEPVLHFILADDEQLVIISFNFESSAVVNISCGKLDRASSKWPCVRSAPVIKISSISIASSLYASGNWISTFSQKSAGCRFAAAATSISLMRVSSSSKVVEKNFLSMLLA